MTSSSIEFPHSGPTEYNLALQERARFLDLSLEMLCVAGFDGQVRWLNPAWETALGFSREELMSRSFVESVHPEDRMGTLDAVERLRAGEAVASFESRHLCRDGSYRWLFWNCSPDPERGLIHAVARDITARKEEEAGLCAADRRAIVEYERLLERIERLAQSLGTARDLLTIFRALREFCVDSMPCDAIFIALYDAARDLRTARYAWAEGVEIDVTSLPPMPVACGPNSRAVRENRIIITHDYGKATRGQPVVKVGPDNGLLPQSSISAPMSVMGRCVGTIELQSHEPVAYKQGHETAMRMAANLAATAIENRQADLALRESESTLRAFYESAPVLMGVVELGDGGDILHLYDNPATAAFLGRGYGTTSGRRASELGVPPGIVRDWVEHYRESERTGRPARFEYAYTSPDDAGERWMSAVVSYIDAQPGGEQRFCYVAEDVTERRRAGEELRRQQESLAESRARLAGVVDSAMDAIISVDEELRVVLFNRAAEEMFGLPANEAIGGPLDRFIPEALRAPHREQIREFGHTGADTRTMSGARGVSGVRADGTEFPLEISISQVVAGGRKLYTAILRDITGRLKLEEQLRRSQKMEAVGQLAGGVAHDFNNLLAAILMSTELALLRLAPGDPARRRLEEVKTASERAADLTRQLLAFSRQQVLRPKVISLNEVVTSMEEMLRRLIGEDIEFTTRLDPVLHRVKADPGQLGQVVMNLAVNARDAMPRGGALIVETSCVTLDEHYSRERGLLVPPGRYAMLAVSDTGNGMDPATQARIFEPFFTTKEVGQGTGLGLSTVYGIIKQSGGFIWVYSEVGRGTTFKVYLPVADGEATFEVEAAPAESPRGDETILVVEDERMIRDLTREVLEMGGYTVIEAADGEEALLACRQHEGPVHLLVTDVVMPKMGGGDLAEKVRQLRAGMRVLFMSGYTDTAVVRHGVIADGSHFIQKPFSPDRLLRKVREVLDA